MATPADSTSAASLASESEHEAHSQTMSPPSRAGTSNNSLPAASGSGAGRGRASERSCIPCHRRKVRCDKQLPCSACTRGKVSCSYPSSVRQPRRARKTTMADVASRISDLERSIAATGQGQTPQQQHQQQPQQQQQHAPFTPASPASTSSTGLPRLRNGLNERARPATCQGYRSTVGPEEHPSSEHVLLRNGSSTQYVSEFLLSRVIEEDQDRSSLLNTPQSDVTNVVSDSPFGLLGILSNPATSTSGAEAGGVSKYVAMQLWQAYVRNVDLSVKVLHLPTCEALVFDAIHRPQQAAADVKALVSSICYSAAVSLDDQETRYMMNMDRVAALQMLKAQLHHNIALSDPLENPTVTLLQALAIYLIAIRSSNHGRGVWLIYGLVMRLAQSIGLHRDGTKLGLSPFETEIRRRLWWFFFTRDCRAAEDHGISSLCSFPPYDTAMPLNVEDTDLHPDMTDFPADRPGWTTMTLPRLVAEISTTLQNLSRVCMSSDDYDTKEAIRRERLDKLRKLCDEKLSDCNPSLPWQKMTMQVARYVLNKICFTTRQQFENLREPDKRCTTPKEEDLITACACLEEYLDGWSDELLRQYRWNMASYPQYHLLLYVIWHLCVSPRGPSIDRGWDVVNAIMEVEKQKHERSGLEKSSLKLVVLQRLHRKAELVRNSVRNEGSGGAQAMETDQEVPVAQNMGSGGGNGNIGGGEETDLALDNLDWSSIIQDIPDWDVLAENFSVMDQGSYSVYI